MDGAGWGGQEELLMRWVGSRAAQVKAMRWVLEWKPSTGLPQCLITPPKPTWAVSDSARRCDHVSMGSHWSGGQWGTVGASPRRHYPH